MHCVPFGGFRGQSLSLPFSASTSQPHSMASGPFLHPHSQHQSIFKSLSDSDFSSFLLVYVKDPCGYVGLTQILQDNLLILRSSEKQP